MSRRGSFSGEDLAGNVVAVVLILGTVLIWFILRGLGRLLVVTVTEAIHLYRDNRFNPDMRHFTKRCTGVLIILIGLSVMVMLLAPAMIPEGIVVMAWSTVASVIAIEVRDHRVRNNDLDDYLTMSQPHGVLGGGRHDAA